MTVREYYRVESENLPAVWFDDPGLMEQWLVENTSTAGKCVCFRIVNSESIHKIYGYPEHPFPNPRKGKKIPYKTKVETHNWHNLNMEG